jgi:aspartate aminotransferase-like enzyme
LFSPGDEIVVCCNGKFGEMWAKFAASYGLVVHRVATDWAKDIDLSEVGGALGVGRTAKGVALTYCDTSTGVCNDVAGVAKVARSHGALVMVDAVSALGGMPFAFDEWGVDFAATASQKCLMSSPGLAFAVLSERAWAANAAAKLPRNYWDFRAIRDSVTRAKPETPGTAPVHLVLQVAEALRMIHEEGLANVHRRHEEMAGAARRGAEALGLAMLFPALARYSPTVTAIALRDGVAARPLRDAIKAKGILTAAAMGTYEPSAIRIGHMGDIRIEDVERTIVALGDALHAIAQ